MILLGLVSAIRPSSMATIYALLSRSRPRTLLTAFFVAGFLFSTVFGLLVITVFNGVDFGHGTGSTINSLFQAIAGGAALGFAAGVASGRVRAQPQSKSPDDSRIVRMLREPSIWMASLAGILTHLPGLIYMLALSAIISGTSDLTEGVFQVVVFNAIWASASIGALAIYLVRPQQTRDLLARTSAWALRHERSFVVPVFGVIGCYFLIHGLRGLV